MKVHIDEIAGSGSSGHVKKLHGNITTCLQRHHLYCTHAGHVHAHVLRESKVLDLQLAAQGWLWRKLQRSRSRSWRRACYRCTNICRVSAALPSVYTMSKIHPKLLAWVHVPKYGLNSDLLDLHGF